MFFLTRERQEVFDAAHTYPFGVEVDGECLGDLYDQHQLARYLDVLPRKFQPEIIERTLFRNDMLLNDFEEWCNETIELCTTKGNAIYAKREAIIERFHPSAQKVFSQSFHDGGILKAEQKGNTFTLLLDMSVAGLQSSQWCS